jgi:hypothetical protein
MTGNTHPATTTHRTTTHRATNLFLFPARNLIARHPRYRVILLTCEYMSSAALITLEFDS